MKFIDAEKRLIVARCWRWEVGKRDEGGQNVETSAYKINKVCGSKVQYGEYS